MLAARTIYAAAQPLHGTTLDRPISQSNFSKRVVRHCEFSEKFDVLENPCIKWYNWKCMVSEQSYLSVKKWPPLVNSHIRVAVGHPFLQFGDWRRPNGPPSWSTSHPSTQLATFQWHVEEHSCSPTGVLQVHTRNRSHKMEGNSYLDWKIDELCQFKRCTATIWLLSDAFFVIPFKTARSRHSENVNKNLELADVLNGAPAAWKKELL
jgi:hypothetical protein